MDIFTFVLIQDFKWSNFIFLLEYIKKSIDDLETKNKEIKSKPINKPEFSFLKYIYYILCCKNNSKIKY